MKSDTTLPKPAARQVAECDRCKARPRMSGFLICDTCWYEVNNDWCPPLPWEM